MEEQQLVGFSINPDYPLSVSRTKRELAGAREVAPESAQNSAPAHSSAPSRPSPVDRIFGH